MSKIKSRRKRKRIINKGSIRKGKLFGVGISSEHLTGKGLRVEIGKLNQKQRNILKKVLGIKK